MQDLFGEDKSGCVNIGCGFPKECIAPYWIIPIYDKYIQPAPHRRSECCLSVKYDIGRQSKCNRQKKGAEAPFSKI